AAHPDLELVAPSPYPLVCFRAVPRAMRAALGQAQHGIEDGAAGAAAGGAGTGLGQVNAQLDELNARLLERINADGRHFLSHTVIPEGYVLRASIGNIRTTEAHVDRLWQAIQAALEGVIA